jgi:quinohemoprotein ethanol dehydrogenase
MLTKALPCCLALLLWSAAGLGGTPADDGHDWPAGGRDGDGSYYSPLDRINADNVRDLGFAWDYDLGLPQRGQEATPLVLDGVMYTSGTWGYVYAVDAATGREIWRFDPKADFRAARNPCCDMVNRGVAVWKNSVYVASVDGRLHALDRATGRKLWEADTITDHSLPYSSTGAPQIAGNLVVIGNSGSDMGRGGVRGYVSAYDLTSGALRWRFYTVPPAPGAPLENPELAAAARTWDPHRKPEYKGGGTAWDAFAYDPALDLVYFGTANAAPYDLRQLGPDQKDSLYTASIIALHARSGRMAWYYQTTPRDSWDYDAVQKLVFADLPVGGKTRHVVLQANKNGFFYVLDRRSGELLSARPFTYVNWATGVDMKTGRPQTTSTSDWYSKPRSVYPSWMGGHTWQPMAYNPKTRLVYIPVLDAPTIWINLVHNGGSVKFIQGFFTANGIIPDYQYDPLDLSRLFGPLPDMNTLQSERKVKLIREILRAWDPVKQEAVWERETTDGERAYDGGTMSTAGNLVFQGRANGELWVYAADTGKPLKTLQTGSHIMAAPMTYAVGRDQYVAVQVGYGGTGIAEGPFPPSSAAMRYQNANRIIAFRLGGGAVPTPPARIEPPFPEPPPQTGSAGDIAAGEIVFQQECTRCHAFGPSITPDLRKLNSGLHAIFKDILLRGAVAPTGMESFADILSEQDVEHVHAYLIDQAWQGYRAQEAAAHPAAHP